MSADQEPMNISDLVATELLAPAVNLENTQLAAAGLDEFPAAFEAAGAPLQKESVRLVSPVTFSVLSFLEEEPYIPDPEEAIQAALGHDSNIAGVKAVAAHLYRQYTTVWGLWKDLQGAEGGVAAPGDGVGPQGGSRAVSAEDEALTKQFEQLITRYADNGGYCEVCEEFVPVAQKVHAENVRAHTQISELTAALERSRRVEKELRDAKEKLEKDLRRVSTQPQNPQHPRQPPSPISLLASSQASESASKLKQLRSGVCRIFEALDRTQQKISSSPAPQASAGEVGEPRAAQIFAVDGQALCGDLARLLAGKSLDGAASSDSDYLRVIQPPAAPAAPVAQSVQRPKSVSFAPEAQERGPQYPTREVGALVPGSQLGANSGPQAGFQAGFQGGFDSLGFHGPFGSPASALPSRMDEPLSSLSRDAGTEVYTILNEIIARCTASRPREMFGRPAPSSSLLSNPPSIQTSESLALAAEKCRGVVEAFVDLANEYYAEASRQMGLLRDEGRQRQGEMDRLQAENADLRATASHVGEIQAQFASFKQSMADNVSAERLEARADLLEVLGAIRTELCDIDAPDPKSKRWVDETVASVATTRRSVSGLLRQTLGLLSETQGRDALSLEAQVTEPSVPVLKAFADEEVRGAIRAILCEAQRAATLALSVRYGVEACLEEGAPAPGAAVPPSAGLSGLPGLPGASTLLSDATRSHEVYSHLGNIVKALLNMSEDSALNFEDKAFTKALRSLLQTLSPSIPLQDVAPFLSQLSGCLQEASADDKVIPGHLADLAKQAQRLEQDLKLATEREKQAREDASRAAATAAEHAQQREDLIRQQAKLELDVKQLSSSLSEAKNDNTLLKTEAMRVPDLERAVEQLTRELDAKAADAKALQSRLASLTQEQAALSGDSIQTANRASALEAQARQAEEHIRTLEFQCAELARSRNDVLGKNKELVRLARAMEERIKALQADGAKVQEAERQLRETLPAYEEQIQRLRQQAQKAEDEISQARARERTLREDAADAVSAQKKVAMELEAVRAALQQSMQAETDLKLRLKAADDTAQQLGAQKSQDDEKIALLGKNLDEVSDRCVYLERQAMDLATKCEVLQAEAEDSHALLAEANTRIQSLERASEEHRTRANKAEDEIGAVRTNANGSIVEVASLKREIDRLEAILAEKREDIQKLSKENADAAEAAKAQLLAKDRELLSLESRLRKEYDARTEAEVSKRMESFDIALKAELESFKQQSERYEQKYNDALLEIRGIYTEKMKLEKRSRELEAQGQAAAALKEKYAKVIRIVAALRKKCVAFGKLVEHLGDRSAGAVKYQMLPRTSGEEFADGDSIVSGDARLDADLHPAAETQRRADDSLPISAVVRIPIPSQAEEDALVTLVEQGVSAKASTDLLEHTSRQLQQLRADLVDERRRSEAADRGRMQAEIEAHKLQVENRDLMAAIQSVTEGSGRLLSSASAVGGSGAAGVLSGQGAPATTSAATAATAATAPVPSTAAGASAALPGAPGGMPGGISGGLPPLNPYATYAQPQQPYQPYQPRQSYQSYQPYQQYQHYPPYQQYPAQHPPLSGDMGRGYAYADPLGPEPPRRRDFSAYRSQGLGYADPRPGFSLPAPAPAPAAQYSEGSMSALSPRSERATPQPRPVGQGTVPAGAELTRDAARAPGSPPSPMVSSSIRAADPSQAFPPSGSSSVATAAIQDINRHFDSMRQPPTTSASIQNILANVRNGAYGSVSSAGAPAAQGVPGAPGVVGAVGATGAMGAAGAAGSQRTPPAVPSSSRP